MPDLLTHVLFVYIVLQLAAWWTDWLTPGRIVVGMAGGTIPDVVKIKLLVPPNQVEAVLGLPFSWVPLHRLGGAVVTAVVLSLLVSARERRGAFVLLVAGLTTHLFIDAFLASPGPYTYDILYPLTHWKMSVLDYDLYLSSDYWPSLASGVVALTLLGITYRDRLRSRWFGSV